MGISSMNTPVLLITFNRPAHTKKVLEAILAAKPQDLYVFQDGARQGNSSDIEKCAEVRQVIETMTSNSGIRLHTLYSDKNLGCGPGPATGITWFFDNVEQGIIIEDDCILGPSGFTFYENMLERFKDDERISAITATNLLLKWRSKHVPYLFSTVGAGTLGCWASWARAWEKFDYYITAWQTEEGKKTLKKNFGNKTYYKYYETIFDKCDNKQTHMWDYQWFFSKMINGTFTVVSSLNQVSNIGFDVEGTHTVSFSRLANFPLYGIPTSLKQLPVKKDILYDWDVFQRYYNPKKKTLLMRLTLKVIDFIFRH